jgi:hypothetical protein
VIWPGQSLAHDPIENCRMHSMTIIDHVEHLSMGHVPNDRHVKWEICSFEPRFLLVEIYEGGLLSPIN